MPGERRRGHVESLSNSDDPNADSLLIVGCVVGTHGRIFAVTRREIYQRIDPLAFLHAACIVAAMEQEVLKSADAVIDALGGTAETSRVTGQALATVSNWRSRERIPPEHFITISKALENIGKKASPYVFRMKDSAESGAVA